jgi:hypothetical protein
MFHNQINGKFPASAWLRLGSVTSSQVGDVGAELRSAMLKQSILPNPLDAQYTGHRDAEKRHLETKEWLRQREREMGFVTDAPPVAPEHHEFEGEKTSALK